MTHYDMVIIGGSVGCLVAACEAARLGKRVRLYLPERGVGSGFGARPFKGRRLDIGTRLFDLNLHPDTMVATPDLSDYRDGDDFRLYMPYIHAFVEDLLEGAVEVLPEAQLSYGGRLVEEFLASLNLSSLSCLLPSDRIARIREETSEILEQPLNGTPVLGRSERIDFSGFSYSNVSLANHGRTFHDLLIAPYSHKVFPDAWQEVPADLRHKIWSPLFYPKTLHEACNGDVERGRRTLQFSSVKGGDFGVFVDRLTARIDASKTIEQQRYGRLLGLRRRGKAIELSFDGLEAPELVRGDLVLGLSVADIVGLNGHSAEIDMLSLGIAWAEVAEDDLYTTASYITVHDPDNPAYRISFGGSGAPGGNCIVNIELSSCVPRDNYETEVRFALEQAGVLRPGASMELLDGLAGVRIPAPTARNRAGLEAAKSRLTAAGIDASYIGTARDMSRDILNQHILQGLVLGA